MYSQNIIFCIFLNDILWQSCEEKVFANYANIICKCNDIISDVQEDTKAILILLENSFFIIYLDIECRNCISLNIFVAL